MSNPNLTLSTPIFAPPVGNPAFSVPASAPSADVQASANGPGDEALSEIQRTTSGALFRCRINDQPDITRLLCCQCSGDNAHVSEATSLNVRSSDASMPRTGILDLSIKGLDLPLRADAKCVERDSPIEAGKYSESAELTQLAQRTVVRCAHNVSDDSECSEWLLLSELPRHHHGTHLAPPRSTLPEPQSSSTAITSGFTFGRPLLATNQPLPTASVPSGRVAPELPVLTGTFGIGLPHNDRPPLFEPAPFPGSSRGVEGNRECIRVLGSGFGLGSGIEFPRHDRPPLFRPPSVQVSELSKDIEGNKKGIDELTKQMADVVKKNNQLETLVAQLSAEVASLGEQLKKVGASKQFSPENSGILRWSIPNFKNDIAAAKLGTGMQSFYSDYFYARSGYLLRARIYPNGDGIGRGTHASLFLTIHKTEKDHHLEWPFKEKVTMSVLDSQGRVLHQDWFAPDGDSSSFQKPVRDHNIASGIPLFVKQEKIDDLLVDGALLLKIAVGNDQTRQPGMAQFSGNSNPSQGRLYADLSQMEH